MGFYSSASIDEAWEKAKDYYCAGLLDGISSMKVSGIGAEPGHADRHVIIYYCACNDASVCKSIGEHVVNMMKYDKPCYYKNDTMNLLVVYRSTEMTPSSTNDAWLYCIYETQMVKYPQNHGNGKWGKWGTFHERASIDEAWKKAKEYYCMGLLGGVSNIKVSGIPTKSEHAGRHVINYYCAYDDASLCKAIGECVVNMMKYDKPCYYNNGTTTLSVVYRPTKMTPSSTSDAWLYCVDETQMVNYPYNPNKEHWGKWMTFYSRASIDEAWGKAKDCYCAGLLDGVSSMKVSGIRTNPEHADRHVINYYCAYNDTSLYKTVGERVVNMMKYDKPCYYKNEAMTLAVVHRSTEMTPSSSSDAWLNCIDEPQVKKYPNNHDNEHWGKWMTFYSRASIDEAWKKAKEYYCAGLLDGVSSMKVSGVQTEPEHAYRHVINYFCAYNDAALCKAVGECVVNMMEYDKPCYYKTNAMSFAGVGRSAKSKPASVMKVAPFHAP